MNSRTIKIQNYETTVQIAFLYYNNYIIQIKKKLRILFHFYQVFKLLRSVLNLLILLL